MTERVFRSLADAVEAYYDELKAFVLRRTGSPALAADVVQDTWVKAAVAAHAEPPGNTKAYLYRMAANLTVDHLRRDRSQARHVVAGDLPEDVPCASPGPERIASARQELALLAETVRDLPEKCREVFLLYRGEGLSMRQIAHRLGISEGTVEKHIARAMLECRKRMQRGGGRP
jgi:RNA polymerase sigma factor, sigma-70 family